MPRIVLTGARLLGIVLALALMTQFVQPQRASAAPLAAGYVLVKGVSAPFSCTGATTPTPTAVATTTTTVNYPTGFAGSTTAQRGQCVAVNFTFTNHTASTLDALSITDNLATFGVAGIPGSCAPSAVTGVGAHCTVTATSFSLLTLASVAPGGTSSRTILVRVPTTATCGSTLTNTDVTSAATAGLLVHQTNVSPAGSTAATIHVSCPTTSGTTLAISKTVNGLACSNLEGCTANVGDTLTYAINYANTGSTAATNATIVDQLSAGQTLLDVITPIGAGWTCTGPTAGIAGTQYETCTTASIPAAGAEMATGTITIHTQVTGTTSPVTNVAAIGAGNVTGTAVSNSTFVAVGSTCGTCSCGTCNPCTTCTSCGTCNPCTTCTSCGTCNPCTTCTSCGTCNPCTTCTCGTCNPCTTSSTCCTTSTFLCGPFGAPTICGVVTAFTPPGSLGAGSLTVGGHTFSIAPGTAFTVPIVVGQSYCFLVDTSGLVTACLSGIPTSITPVGAHRSFDYVL